MIQYLLKKNQNEKMPSAFGKYFAYPVITQTYDVDKLVDHMATHNSPFSRGAIKGIVTDMVSCIRELALQGIAVKIDDLAIFSIGIKNKQGADSEKEFTVTKNVEGLKMRARGTGDFSCSSLSLDGTLKKATIVASDSTSASTDEEDKDDTEDTTKPSGGSSSEGTSGGGTSGGGSSTGGGDDGDDGDGDAAGV